MWFSADRGYGFVKRDDGEADAFLHASALFSEGLTNVAAGDRLEFGLELSPRTDKLRAVQIRALPKFPPRGLIDDGDAPQNRSAPPLRRPEGGSRSNL